MLRDVREPELSDVRVPDQVGVAHGVGHEATVRRDHGRRSTAERQHLIHGGLTRARDRRERETGEGNEDGVARGHRAPAGSAWIGAHRISSRSRVSSGCVGGGGAAMLPQPRRARQPPPATALRTRVACRTRHPSWPRGPAQEPSVCWFLAIHLSAFSTVGRYSLGMSSLRDRTELIGGRLTVHSLPGEGTTVSVSVPLTD